VNLFLATESGGGFHVPPLEELFVFDPLFGDGIFAFNRVSLLYVLSAVIIGVVLYLALKDATIIPNKLQNIVESLVQFVREQIALEVMGPEGLKFVPLLTAIFLFVWVNNFFEVVPLVQLPSTGRMAGPAFLALMVWTIFILVGVKSQGPAYFKNVAIPGGVPAFVLPLVIPIEIVSTFIVRPLTLAVRLFANMMAGHILLAIIFIAANAFLLDVHDFNFAFNLKGSPIGLVALAAGPAMVGFEMMVGALQAYIFTILTAVYIGGSLHPEH